MDVTLKKYMGKNSEELFDIMSEYAEKIKKVNGEFVSLFHNESLSDDNFGEVGGSNTKKQFAIFLC